MNKRVNNKANELAQYHECIQSFHHLERASWQLPSFAIILLSIIGSVAWGVLDSGYPRVILLLIGGILMLSFALAAGRFSLCMSQQVGIIMRIRALEEQLGLQFIYGSYSDLYEGKKGASVYLTCALFIIAVLVFVLAILAIVEVV
ncbi:hypothetical protein ACFLWZ_08760 [Chloroflexota bacterium]